MGTLAPAPAVAQSLPPGWATSNIGNASPAGSAAWAGGEFTVKAGGQGVTARSDQFRFVFQQLSGDGTIVARVTQIGGSQKARAGVMIRESLASGSRHAALLIDADGDGSNLLFRPSTGGQTYFAGSRRKTSAPVWLQLTRTGNTLSAAQSVDGASWSPLGSVTVAMTKVVYVGLAVASRSWNVESAAVFSNVSGAPTTTTNQLPSVSMASPAGPFTAPAGVTLNATASDTDGTISRVDFYAGSTLLGSDASSPYAYAWSNVAAGVYTVKAVATDDAGGTATSTPLTVTVATTLNKAPTAALSAPAGPFTAPASITMSAVAGDTDGTVSRVDFYAGAALLGSDSASPYSFVWANAPTGVHALKAVATDNQGATGASTTVNVTVTSPNSAPTVSLNAPAGPYTAPASVTLTAAAADSDGSVARVEFYQGAALLGSDTSSPYAYTVPSLAAGTHTFKAVAVDDKGATGTSAFVTVSVGAAANTPPTVSLTSPASGSMSVAPQNVMLAATAADSDGSIARVDFYNGATLIGTDSTAPYGISWTNGWLAVEKGTYAFRAVAVDNAGASTSSAVANVTVGTTTTNKPPTVSLTSPANGATLTAPANVTVTASATDTDGTVSRVDFFDGAALIGSDASSPYAVTWAGAPTGVHQFKAVAVDNGGASATSASSTVTITSNQAPLVSLATPVGGASFAAPATVALTATASDPDGTIARVDFYSGTTKIGSSSGSPYSFAWTGVAVGTYTLTAVAFDNSGLSTASSAVQMQVTDPNLPHNAVWTPSTNDATAVSTYIIELFPNGVNPTTANPVATHDVGKPGQVNGEYVADISGVISGLPSGTYVATVTAVGTAGSAQSAPSPAFTK